MNCYVFIEIFEFVKRSVETLCNLHNFLDAFIYVYVTLCDEVFVRIKYCYSFAKYSE